MSTATLRPVPTFNPPAEISEPPDPGVVAMPAPAFQKRWGLCRHMLKRCIEAGLPHLKRSHGKHVRYHVLVESGDAWMLANYFQECKRGEKAVVARSRVRRRKK